MEAPAEETIVGSPAGVEHLLSVLLLLLLLVCLPRGVPVTLCPRARTAERIAGPVACRPECTETYISLPGRLTSGTSESRAKFTTTKARASFELGVSEWRAPFSPKIV